MDGQFLKTLIEWLDTFEASSAEKDAQHIDAFALIPSKDKWLDIAFNLYDNALLHIHKKGYHFSVFLVFYLNTKKTPSKHLIREMTSRLFSHQITPPEMYLIKNPVMIEQWKTAGVPLVHFGSRYGGMALYEEYYSEEDNCYERTVMFIAK